MSDAPDTTDADVLVCGGGMAGLTLALQLRRDVPDARVVVVERTARPLPRSCHKVGESTAELGSQYLERLGLREYLRREHIVKLGLRFFPGGGHVPLSERAEFGPSQEPIVNGYQLDRGRLEEDLRRMVEDAGVLLHEGTMIRGVELGRGGAPHEVTLDRASEPSSLRAKWFVDATGRNAFLKRRLKLRRGSRHSGHAGWFRIDGRLPLSDLVPDRADPWHHKPLADQRWRSTNHLMGEGYWVWIIPLPGEVTSIGVVTHDEVYGFDRVRTHERAIAFLREVEPGLAALLQEATPLDFRCIKNYCYTIARGWSPDRWAIVGEAGAFVDPLYSPGADFIAWSNDFTTELVRRDLAGEDLAAKTTEFNILYRAFVSTGIALHQGASKIYARPRVMATKIYWDNFLYWAFACQYYLQGMHRVDGDAAQACQQVGARFQDLSTKMQALFIAWADVEPPDAPSPGFIGLPAFPSLPVDAHVALQRTMTPDETVAYMTDRLDEIEQMAAEIVVRLLLEYGPQEGGRLVEQAGALRWGLRFEPTRASSEGLVGLQRRHALSKVTRDVERNLGRVPRHDAWTEALAGLPGVEPVSTPASGAVAR